MVMSPLMVPSADRLVQLDRYIPRGSYGAVVSPVSIQLPPRRTIDAVDWWIDVTPLLSPNTADFVVAARTAVTPAGTAGDLVVLDVQLSGAAVGFLLSGGRVGVTYTITSTLDTLSGRTITIEIVLAVSGSGLSVGQSGSTPWAQDTPLGMRVKRGATLIATMTFFDDAEAPINLTGAVVTGQIRSAGGYRLVEQLDIVVTADPTVAALTVLDTAVWPVGRAECSIQLTRATATVTTTTFPIAVDRPVTLWYAAPSTVQANSDWSPRFLPLHRLETILMADTYTLRSTVTALASSATSQIALPTNTARTGLIATNTDSYSCFLKFGEVASSTSFTVEIPSGGYWELLEPAYLGRIDAIWAADGPGSLVITELT